MFLLLVYTASVAADAPDLPVVAANDNRTSAGELKNGKLTLRLELRRARWYPDRDTGPSIALHAFGEAGKAPQLPAPLIRVPQGTEIIATVQNLLPAAVTVYGLHSHVANANDTFEVAAGATREVRFKVGPAGTYTYWATTSHAKLEARLPDDMQLSGAFVVDPPGKVAADRIFVLGLWIPDTKVLAKNVASINGKSWPYTEPLSARIGETASWRVINGSIVAHAMHLHGFYFQVGSLGDGQTDTLYASDRRPSVVTQHVPPGGTMSMAWAPDREGTWLFHCHMAVHMSPHMVIPGDTDPTAHTEHADASGGMGGLVLGVKVTGETAKAPRGPAADIRQLKLVMSERETGWPRFKLDLQDALFAGAKPVETTTIVPPPVFGPLIVLTRGQPAEIEVVNNFKDSTAIHWHGMELESLYDGVPGISGDSHQTTPPILPGASFVAKFTPRRAGTFMYHTHWHDEEQIVSGVYGPLIVLEPGDKFDPVREKIFLFSTGSMPRPLVPALLLNGTPQPFRMRLRTGEKYRFRMINITDNGVEMQVSLSEAGRPVQWKAVAKDGAELPAPLATAIPARGVLTVGETRDFEYQSSSPAQLQMEAFLPLSGRRIVLEMVFEDGK